MRYIIDVLNESALTSVSELLIKNKVKIVVSSKKRLFLSIEASDLSAELRQALQSLGATIIEDYQYDSDEFLNEF